MQNLQKEQAKNQKAAVATNQKASPLNFYYHCPISAFGAISTKYGLTLNFYTYTSNQANLKVVQ